MIRRVVTMMLYLDKKFRTDEHPCGTGQRNTIYKLPAPDHTAGPSDNNVTKRYWQRIKKTRLCGPVIVLLGTTWLLYHLHTSPLYSGGAVVTHQFGPLSWPEYSLTLLLFVTGLLCIGRAWRCISSRSKGDTDRKSGAVAQGCDNQRLVIGGWMVLLYGLGFVYVGFLISTIVFLLAWMIHGGVRNPIKLISISVAGTLAPLYLLVKVAYMPLPRGIGIFETLTTLLYGWLSVF